MTSKQLVFVGKLAFVATSALLLLAALWHVLTTRLEPSGQTASLRQARIANPVATTVQQPGPGRVLSITATYSAETGPAVEYAWSEPACWPQRLPSRGHVSAKGKGIPFRQTWSACVIPADAHLSTEVWSSVADPAELAPDAVVLTVPLKDPTQTQQGVLIGAAVGYCTDDGWCAATLVWGPSRHRPSLSTSVPTQRGPVVYVQANSWGNPESDEWAELTSVETDPDVPAPAGTP